MGGEGTGPEVGIFLVTPEWRWTIIFELEEDSLGGNDGVQVKNRSRQKHYFPKWHVVTEWNWKIFNTLETFVLYEVRILQLKFIKAEQFDK